MNRLRPSMPTVYVETYGCQMNVADTELLRGGDGDPHVALRLDPSETYADLPVAREGGVRAWVTVMRGCDRFCTFCIVPYVRGRERSLPGRALVAQVRALAAAGVREVV